ncbi:MAG: hypothetical protein V1729_06875 [Candidatus Woesearchaeota archaeon]
MGYVGLKWFLRDSMLAAGAVAMLGLGSGCAQIKAINRVLYDFRMQLEGQQEYRPIVTEMPYLDIENSMIHPVTYLSRVEGESQLERLANTSEIEEGWLFFEIEGQERGKWLDVSYDQHSATAKQDLQFIREQIAIMDRLGKEVSRKISCTAYHIHPVSVIMSTNREWSSALDVLGRGYDEVGQYHMEVFAVPSHHDYVAHMGLEELFKENFSDSAVSLSASRVVVPTGRFDYSLTDKFLEGYIGQDYKKMTDMIFNAYVTGYDFRDVGKTLESLRENGIDILYTRTRTIDKPLKLW